MRFSWTGLILAPLLAPLIFSALFLVFAPGNNSAFGFLILFVPSCFISCGTTIFLFLPSLFLLSLWRPLTGWQVCLLGLIMALGIPAIAWIENSALILVPVFGVILGIGVVVWWHFHESRVRDR